MIFPIHQNIYENKDNKSILFCNDQHISNIVKLIIPIGATIITVLLAFTFASFFGGVIITPIRWIIAAGANLTILFFCCHNLCNYEINKEENSFLANFRNLEMLVNQVTKIILDSFGNSTNKTLTIE